MAGKVLIYGGSGGIGSATARALRTRGYELHLVGRGEEKLAAIAHELSATFTAGDANDQDVFARVSRDVRGPLDGLVYAVGTINLKPLHRLTDADFLKDFRFCGVVLERRRPAGLHVARVDGHGERSRAGLDALARR